MYTGGPWPDAKPPNRNNPYLNLAEKIASFQVPIGLIFLQHHKTRSTQNSTIPLKQWTCATRPTQNNRSKVPF